MRRQFKKQFRQSHPSATRLKVRVFVDEPGAGWKAIGINRGIAFMRGEVSIPEYAEVMIRVAFAYVETVERKPVALQNLSISNAKVGKGGIVDQGDQMRQILKYVDGKPSNNVDSIPMEQEIETIKRCLKIDGA